MKNWLGVVVAALDKELRLVLVQLAANLKSPVSEQSCTNHRRLDLPAEGFVLFGVILSEVVVNVPPHFTEET